MTRETVTSPFLHRDFLFFRDYQLLKSPTRLPFRIILYLLNVGSHRCTMQGFITIISTTQGFKECVYKQNNMIINDSVTHVRCQNKQRQSPYKVKWRRLLAIVNSWIVLGVSSNNGGRLLNSVNAIYISK